MSLHGPGGRRNFLLYAHGGYLIKVDVLPSYPLLSLAEVAERPDMLGWKERAVAEALLRDPPPDLPLLVTWQTSRLLQVVVGLVVEASRGRVELLWRYAPGAYRLLGGGISLREEVLDLYLPPLSS